MSIQFQLGNGSWQDLYKAALFETDRTKAPVRIADAESAIVVRARALFHQSENVMGERIALDAALYALHMLRNCVVSKHAA